MKTSVGWGRVEHVSDSIEASRQQGHCVTARARSWEDMVGLGHTTASVHLGSGGVIAPGAQLLGLPACLLWESV